MKGYFLPSLHQFPMAVSGHHAIQLLPHLCLENSYVSKPPPVSLQIVFLPLLAFEVAILVDNFM
ncbi:hypothetical protein Hanom_Chr14g01301561 [Helianthus anomalus]